MREQRRASNAAREQPARLAGGTPARLSALAVKPPRLGASTCATSSAGRFCFWASCCQRADCPLARKPARSSALGWSPRSSTPRQTCSIRWRACLLRCPAAAAYAQPPRPALLRCPDALLAALPALLRALPALLDALLRRAVVPPASPAHRSPLCACPLAGSSRRKPAGRWTCASELAPRGLLLLPWSAGAGLHPHQGRCPHPSGAPRAPRPTTNGPHVQPAACL